MPTPPIRGVLLLKFSFVNWCVLISFVIPMARNTDLIQLRNANVKKRYRDLSEKYPQWRNDAVIEEVSKQFYLATRTITAILNNEGNYGQTA